MYTLTSDIGRFVFDVKIPLSHAKLIRDSVVGAIKTNQQPPPTNAEAKRIVNALSGSVRLTEFIFYPFGGSK